MRNSRFTKYLPKASELRESSVLRPVRGYLKDPEIWHMHRRSVAGAVFIGLFCAWLPVPLQMLVAATLAIVSRCNLPISVVLVWITNPVTIPPMFYFSYRLGAWLLDMRLHTDTIELSLGWLIDNLEEIGYPLVFGSLVCGWVSAVTGFVLVRVLWRFHVISRWRARHARRRARQLLERLPTPRAAPPPD